MTKAKLIEKLIPFPDNADICINEYRESSGHYDLLVIKKIIYDKDENCVELTT